MNLLNIFKQLIDRPRMVKISHGAPPYADHCEVGTVRSVRGSEILVEVGEGILIYVDQKRLKILLQPA